MGRLFFAGALLLGLAWAALRSPVPAIDARYLREDFPGEPLLSVSAWLSPDDTRDRARAAITACASPLRAAPAAPAATDAGAACLAASKIDSFMLNFAGNAVTAGRRGAAPWRIGLRHPQPRGPDDALAYVLAGDREAVATRLGSRPDGLQQVSVFAADAATAAAGADALLAAGPAQWRAQARALRLDQALVLLADGSVQATGTLAPRLKFLHGEVATVVP